MIFWIIYIILVMTIWAGNQKERDNSKFKENK